MDTMTPAMPNYPRIIAHRGGGALAPENTLSGIEIARRMGCKGVEFDVMLSRDGIPLLIHDETLERTSTGCGHVAQLTAEEIRAFDVGGPHHPAYAVLPAPTFDEALDLCASLQLWVNIEIKPAAGYELATGFAVAERLRKGWHENGIVSSFSLAALQAFRQNAPNLPVALLFEDLPADWEASAHTLNATAIHLAAKYVTPAIATRLSTRPWACYTVNRRVEAERLFALGCHAVFTDRPDLWAVSEM